MKYAVWSLILLAAVFGASCGDDGGGSGGVGIPAPPPSPPPSPPSPTVLFFDDFGSSSLDLLDGDKWNDSGALVYVQHGTGNPGNAMCMQYYSTYPEPGVITEPRFVWKDLTFTFDAKFFGTLYWEKFLCSMGYASIEVYSDHVETSVFLGTRSERKSRTLFYGSGWRTFKFTIDDQENFCWSVDGIVIHAGSGMPVVEMAVLFKTNSKVLIDNVKVTSP